MSMASWHLHSTECMHGFIDLIVDMHDDAFDTFDAL